jgi:hypothetical protein
MVGGPHRRRHRQEFAPTRVRQETDSFHERGLRQWTRRAPRLGFMQIMGFTAGAGYRRRYAPHVMFYMETGRKWMNS